MANPTKKPRPDKPEKPYPGFPLFPHANGRWAKKIRGKLHYFGRWDDPNGALERYLEQRDDLHAGRKPPERREGVTVGDACNLFLDAKDQKVQNGELSPVSWRAYKLAAKTTLEVFDRNRVVTDLGPADFALLRRHLTKTNGLLGQKNKITITRMIFRYAFEAGLIPRPIRFGPDFSRPSAKSIRSQRKPKMFERDAIRTMLDHADTETRCMVLMGCNCAFGPSDLSKLPWSAIDLENGWCDFPRPKTATPRHVPLWDETVRALRAMPREKGQAHVFAVPPQASGRSGDWLCDRFRGFLKRIGLYQRQRGLYGLRHSFETIGGESRDPVAVRSIMGHELGDADMGAHYRERVSDERLRAVVDAVRTWLFEPLTGEQLGEKDAQQTNRFRIVG